MANAINCSRVRPPSRYTCISLDETMPNRMRCRTTCGVTPNRAAISSGPQPCSSASFLNASNWSAGCMFSRVTFSSRLISCGSFRGVDDAADRLGLLDLLALHPKKLGEPPAPADGDEIEPRRQTIPIQFRLDDKVLQNTFGGDACGIGLNGRLAVRRPARVLW